MRFVRAWAGAGASSLVVRALVAGWWTCTLLVGATCVAFGVAAAPQHGLVAICVLALLVGPLTAVTLRAADRLTTSAFTVAACASAASAAVMLGAVGVDALGQVAVPVVALLALTGLPVGLRTAGAGGLLRAHAGASAGAWGSAAELRRAMELDVHSGDLQDLCWLWQVTARSLTCGSDPYATSVLADIRRRCLDELEHRDPHGFTDWLRADARPSHLSRFLSASHSTPSRDRPDDR